MTLADEDTNSTPTLTHASGAMLLPNLVQVTESISGSVVPLAMFPLALVLNLGI